MEVHFPADLQTRLAQRLTQEGRDLDETVQDVVTRYFEEEDRFVEAVKTGRGSFRVRRILYARTGGRAAQALSTALMQVRWSLPATEDLERICAWIERDNPEAANRVAVESVPGKVSRAWVFKDTRLPVATVIENLGDLSVDEVMEQFDVTWEQINAVLDFVAQRLKTPAPER